MSVSESSEAALTREQALREVLRVQGWSKPLLQRAVGLTWMLWAVVSGGIFVTYEAIGIAHPSSSTTWVASGLAWIPWVFLGIVATSVLWQSLALVLPSKSGGVVRTTVWVTAVFLVFALGGLAVVTLANVPIDGTSFAMIAIGFAAAVAGGSGLTTDSRPERGFWLGGGVALALLAVGIDLVAGRLGYDSTTLLLVVGPIASTSLLFGGGLYTAAA